MKILKKISKAIICLSEKIEKINGKLPELIALAVYCIGHLLMSLVHEPWFDEALAWLISRDSSVKTVLFEATHYEGHPGLWHLILMPFAKLGAPYELSLSIVSLLFSGAAVTIILFKAPYKRIIRLLIPFTYFMFYQYSVVSRPYCMMMLAFVLIAMNYKEKDEKPVKYFASLAFMCATSAYGVVLAGGLCIVWLIEMYISVRKNTMDGKKTTNNETDKKNTFLRFISELCNKKKIIYFILLLAYALSIIWRILPASDAYASIRAQKAEAVNGPVARTVYTVLTSLSDLFLTNVYCASGTIRDTEMYTIELWAGAAIGAVILIIIILYGKRHKKLMTFVIPYLMFSVFSSIVYLYKHHIGIELLLIGFFLWICMEETDGKKIEPYKINEEKNNVNKNKQSSLEEIKTLLPSLTVIVITIIMVIPIYWNVSSCICDIKYEYSYGRQEYNYLKNNNLENATILCESSAIFNEETDGYATNDVTFSLQAVCIAPYLKNNTIYNRDKCFDLSYALLHKTLKTEKNEKIKMTISEMEPPDVIMGTPEINMYYSLDQVSMNDYVSVYEERTGMIWKGIPGSSSSAMYVKKSLLH